MKRILLTGGGTAGHVTPNIALLPGLLQYGFEVHYAGSHAGIERDLIEREHIPYHPLSAGKLRRYFDLKNLTDQFKIAVGFAQATALIARLRPHVVFSKGGFVSTPVVWASWLLGIPVIIHESDITPGLANKLSIPCARKICYSFPETARHLPVSKRIHTGLPVRKTLFEGNPDTAKVLCGYETAKPVILVICGSQGSQIINSAVHEARTTLLQTFNICHICGKGNITEDEPGYRQFEYVNEELPHLFALADIVISRAGATTLFELLSLKKPALLIPLATNASRGDQILNAQSFHSQGFSHVLEQKNLTSEALISHCMELFSARDSLRAAMENSPVGNGVESVLEVIRSHTK